jgi:hypothetical protein
MSRSLSSMASGLARVGVLSTLVGCNLFANETTSSPSADQVSESVQIDRSLGKRLPLSSAMDSDLSVDGTSIHLGKGVEANSETALFLGNVHIFDDQFGDMDRISPEVQAHQRDLFYQGDALIRDYNVRIFGLETCAYMPVMRDLYLESGLSLDAFIDSLLQNSEIVTEWRGKMYGASFTPIHAEIYRVALDDSLTFEQRHQLLERYIGMAYSPFLLEAIYWDSPDIDFRNFDINDLTDSFAVVRAVSKFRNRLEDEDVVFNHAGQKEIPLAQMVELAQGGDDKAANAYCLHRSHYLEDVGKVYHMEYEVRNASYLTQIGEAHDDLVMAVGVNHVDGLVQDSRSSEGFSGYVDSGSLRTAVLLSPSKRGLTRDDQIFSEELYMKRFYEAWPDMTLSRDGTSYDCKTWLSSSGR